MENEAMWEVLATVTISDFDKYIPELSSSTLR